MDIIPAIDLLAGSCVRLRQGDYDQVTTFCSDPVKQALSWQSQGAARLHLVDMDAARGTSSVNDNVIREVVGALDIPVQVGGGVRNEARAKELIQAGVDRVILGTAAIEEPQMVLELAAKLPGRVLVGIDARQGRVATRGWLEESDVEADALARRFEGSQVAAIVSTDIASDGMLEGPNLEVLRRVALATDLPVLASGGVSDLTDVLSLLAFEPLGVSGLIVGRALYDGQLDLQEALQAAADGRLQDPTSRDMA